MSKNNFSVTAVVAIRNGAFYFNRLCQHMRDNNISLAVIDNSSEDNLQALISDNQDVIVASSSLAYEGVFDLTKQLNAKQRMIETLHSDWIIHLDVDELLFSDTEGESLYEAIKRVSALGYNAINFDEFVFLPVDMIRDYKSTNYHKMVWYYFFEPRPLRLIRAFRRDLKTRVNSGGHDIEGAKKLYPHNMIMRHFMFENKVHAEKKYRQRLYSVDDIENKFHGNRVPLQSGELKLPPRRRLMKVRHKQWVLNKDDPKQKHFWQWH